MTEINVFENSKQLTDKEILGEDMPSEYIKYDMIAEYKEIHAQAKEHITKCMICTQKAARHHLGIGHPLDENALKQGVHYINSIADMSTRYLNSANESFTEIQKENREFKSFVKDINETILKNSKDQATEFKRQNKEYFDTMRDDMKLYIKIIGIAVVPVAAAMIAIFEVYKRITN